MQLLRDNLTVMMIATYPHCVSKNTPPYGDDNFVKS